jgi:hypothetical protein
MPDKVLAALTKASKGLLYPSERDAPFEAFVWEEAANTVASVRRLTGLPAAVACRQVSLDDFFVDLVEEDDFARLRAALDRTLSDIQVYRCGTTDVTYYLVGTAKDGRLAGLKTTAVET